MKSKEEIEHLGKQSAQKKYRLQHIPLEQIDEYGGEIKDYVTIFIQGYTQCQKDNADNFLSLIEEYREKELPNKDVPYHYEAEIDSGLKCLIMFIKNKQD